MLFLKSVTSLFFAQWKPVREVISKTGSLHIKGFSEEFWNVFYVVVLLWLELNFSLSSGFLSSGFPSSPPYGLIQFSASTDWGQSIILVCASAFVCVFQSEKEEIRAREETVKPGKINFSIVKLSQITIVWDRDTLTITTASNCFSLTGQWWIWEHSSTSLKCFTV